MFINFNQILLAVLEFRKWFSFNLVFLSLKQPVPDCDPPKEYLVL